MEIINTRVRRQGEAHTCVRLQKLLSFEREWRRTLTKEKTGRDAKTGLIRNKLVKSFQRVPVKSATLSCPSSLTRVFVELFIHTQITYMHAPLVSNARR